jgi:hypothetical protein
MRLLPLYESESIEEQVVTNTFDVKKWKRLSYMNLQAGLHGYGVVNLFQQFSAIGSCKISRKEVSVML